MRHWNSGLRASVGRRSATFAIAVVLSSATVAALVAGVPARAASSGFLSWALLDRNTGEIIGSRNLAKTTDTASMIKAWLAADYLRRADEADRKPTRARLDDLESMIRDSDNDAADRTYAANGGRASIKRLISLCELTESTADRSLWSNTRISARDAVRMGACLADGRAAGDWTDWLLEMMCKVRGDGDFGIRDAFEDDERDSIAIKNGWLLRDEDNAWHTNCLAITDDWVIAVLQRYPSRGNGIADFNHTAEVCAEVGEELLRDGRIA